MVSYGYSSTVTQPSYPISSSAAKMAGKSIAPLPGGQVLVDAVGADVLQVHVGDLGRHLADHLGRVVADAEQVADVAVHPHQRLIGEVTHS